MKKKVILRCAAGFPAGVAIGYLITIIISAIAGGGHYFAVEPSLAKECGSEIGAVILQFVLCGILGAASAGSSAIFENDNWSMLKQTIVHFLVITIAFFPIAFFTHWMPRTFLGILGYIGVFVAIYVCIWIIMYVVLRRKIRALSKHMEK